MINFFRNYFSYSRKELRSFYYLILVLCFSIIFRVYQGNSEISAILPDKELLAMNQSFVESLSLIENAKKTHYKKREDLNITYFSFDPNKIDPESMRKMDFGEKVISNILKYREKGGAFRKPEDLKMIYGLDDAKFALLQSWINIENYKLNIADKKEKEILEHEDIVEYDLNTIAFKELLTITNGDSRISGRILKYRSLLGGFYSMEQLNEVYDMNDSIYELLLPSLQIDTSSILKLSLNTSSYIDLLKHPYIKKEYVDLIMKYREFRNSEIVLSEFTESGLFSDTIMNRIQPYLKN